MHEEIAPSLLAASNALNQKISISLHAGSLNNKGDVFDAFSRENLAGHCITYRPSGPIALPPGQQLDTLIKHMGSPCIFFLTLQNEWTVDLARNLQRRGLQVYGIIHNINKVCRNPEVLSFWREGLARPVVLSSYLRDNLAAQLNRRPEDIELLYSSFEPDEMKLHCEENDKQQTHIAIAGSINYSSRPFEILLQTLVSLKRQRAKVANNLVFHLLGGGPDRNRLIKEVAACGLQDNFYFTKVDAGNGRSMYSDYYKELCKCNYLIALDVDQYTTNKITSTVPTSISFLRPLIATQHFLETYSLQGVGLASDNLAEALSHASAKLNYDEHVGMLRKIRTKQLQHNTALVNRMVGESDIV